MKKKEQKATTKKETEEITTQSGKVGKGLLKAKKNKRDLIEALKKNCGIITTACKLVGLNRSTHYRWLEEDPEYKKAFEDVHNVTRDFVVSMLFKKITEGDITAIIFWLKKIGRGGYEDEPQNTIVVSSNELENKSDAELLKILERKVSKVSK